MPDSTPERPVYRNRKTGSLWTSSGRFCEPWGRYYTTHLTSAGGRTRRMTDTKLEAEFELVTDG